MDIPGLSSRLAELLPEPRQVHIDGLVGASVRLVPHLGQELALAHHPAGPLDQVDQQLELSCRELQLPTLEHDLLRVEINGNLPNFDGPLMGIRTRSSQDRTNSGLEVLRRVRLHDVVVGTRVEQSHDLALIVSGSGNNNRHISNRPDHPKDLASIQIRETKVEYDNIETSRYCSLNPRHRSCGGVYLMAPFGKAT